MTGWADPDSNPIADILAFAEADRARSLARDHGRPPALILHPEAHAEMRRRGWIADDGVIDWAKVVADTEPGLASGRGQRAGASPPGATGETDRPGED